MLYLCSLSLTDHCIYHALLSHSAIYFPRLIDFLGVLEYTPLVSGMVLP
jgi:hypothetical protein